MTDEEFEAWEATYLESTPDADDLRVALLWIRGYALSSCDVATKARDQLDHAVTGMLRARRRAERALAKCRRACEHAELTSRFAARCMAGDTPPEMQLEVAALLEEMLA